jgi:ankyrin repeat protein
LVFWTLLVEHGADSTVTVTAQDWTDWYGSTSPHDTSSSGNVGLVRFLVEYGADVIAVDGDESIPLHQLASACQVDMAARDYWGSTPLHQAASHGNVDLARLLVERGADAAAHGNHGSTPLHQASVM